MNCPLSKDQAPADFRPDPEKLSSPALSMEQAESFWNEGSYVVSAQPGSIAHISMTAAPPREAPFCCVGIDQPGVGHVHEPGCEQAGEPKRSVLPGRSYLAGQISDRLAAFVSDPACVTSAGVIGKEVRELIAEIDAAIEHSNAVRDQRERLLIQLLFASRDLAAESISIESSRAVCRCGAIGDTPTRIQHARTCNAHRVQRILSDLFSLDLNPNGKEAAPDGETGCAGDGIRLRGLAERVCLKCGARGGDWHAEKRPAGEIDLSLLGLNQLVSDDGDGESVTLYTHRCGLRSKGGAK